ncbi:hypothetical protein BRM33_21300, partial [Xanthomonas oryzae pv. oryzae]
MGGARPVGRLRKLRKPMIIAASLRHAFGAMLASVIPAVGRGLGLPQGAGEGNCSSPCGPSMRNGSET